MPILPAFDEHGDLPRGVYSLTVEEVVQQLGMATPKRRWLGQYFKRIVDLLRTIGEVERILLWGSFVTAKENPGDLDMLVVMKTTFERAKLQGEVALLFDYIQAKARFHADIFWVKNDIGQEAIELFIETYQLSKDRRWRGIVEVKL